MPAQVNVERIRRELSARTSSVLKSEMWEVEVVDLPLPGWLEFRIRLWDGNGSVHASVFVASPGHDVIGGLAA